MTLYTPSKEEAQALLTAPNQFRGYTVVQDALPPPFLLQRAIVQGSSDWLMPRLFMDDETKEIVGSACFKTEPQNGQIEIGYGISPQRQCRGFATRGTALLIEEAFACGTVQAVLAASTPGNVASRRVVEKLGFKRNGSGMDDEEGPVDLWIKERILGDGS